MLLPSQLKEESLDVMDWCGDEVPVQEIMIVSFYKKVDHLGKKEAAGSVVLILFLGQVIEALDVTLHRQHLLDAQFTVTRTESRGRNPSCDFVQYVICIVSQNHLTWVDLCATMHFVCVVCASWSLYTCVKNQLACETLTGGLQPSKSRYAKPGGTRCHPNNLPRSNCCDPTASRKHSSIICCNVIECIIGARP